MGFEHDLDFSFVQFIKDVINCLPICNIPLITDVPRNSTGRYVEETFGVFFYDSVSTSCVSGSRTELSFFERMPRPFLFMSSTFM